MHLHGWQELTVIVSRVPQCCASLLVGSALGFLPFESRVSRVFLFVSFPDVTYRPNAGQEVLRLHFNFRIGAVVPEVSDECKFGPCAYTSVSRCLMSLT